jgi:hypothetical protein
MVNLWVPESGNLSRVSVHNYIEYYLQKVNNSSEVNVIQQDA